MTHPHQLHALAAAASLRIALVSLGRRAAAERYGWATASDGLRSPSWATGGRGQGGHGDPVAESVTSTVRTAGDTRAVRTYATLAWLARGLLLNDEAPLDAIEYNLPRLAPSTAWQLTLWLRELDGRCRDTAGLDGGLVGLDGVTCPACGEACVYRNAAGLHECLAALCLCAGEACRCAMPIKADGVQHIWAATSEHWIKQRYLKMREEAQAMVDEIATYRWEPRPGKVRGLRAHGFYLDEWTEMENEHRDR